VKNRDLNFLVEKVGYFDLDGDAKKKIWQKAQEVVFSDTVTGNSISKNQAKAKMMWSDEGLFILWQVEDEHIWGTFENDDDPIYDEEVVEIFIAKGENIPNNYFEFQFSPLGVKFDAKIKNPTGDRHDSGFNVDIGWNCESLKFIQHCYPERRLAKGETSRKTTSRPFPGTWVTEAFIPWKSLNVENAKKGDIFRANLFRIDGYPKQNSFQAWQPTLLDPPNFHVPSKFGFLELE